MSLPYEFIRLDTKQGPQENSYDTYHAILTEEALARVKATTREPLSEEVVVAIGGHLHGKPICLAAAIFSEVLKTAELQIFFVQEGHSTAEVGAALLERLVDELKKLKAYICTFVYILEDTQTPDLEKALKMTKWDGPRLFMLRYLFDFDVFNPYWLHLPYRYPDGFEEFFWKDLTPAERKQVAIKEKSSHFPIAISPFQDEDKIEPLNSLGLKYKGEIVAWMLTHRMDENTIRYSSFYVDRSIRDRSLSTKLLAKSILLQKATPIRWTTVDIPLLVVHRHWVHFVKKRLEPYAYQVTHLLQSWTSLH